MNSKNPLALNGNVNKISEAPLPEEIFMTLQEFDAQKNTLSVNPGDAVSTGMLLFGNTYATATGTYLATETIPIGDSVIDVLRIKTSGDEKLDPELPSTDKYLEKSPSELLQLLNRLNLDFQLPNSKIDLVIINALDTDPLCAVSQQILRENIQKMDEAIALIKHLTQTLNIVLAVSKFVGESISAINRNNLKIVYIDPIYPNSLPELIARDLSKKSLGNPPLYLPIEKMFAALDALKSGKPMNHKIVTLVEKGSTKNLRVRIGTPIGTLLENKIQDNDKIVVGGPMRGEAIYNFDTPVTAATDCILHEDSQDVIHFRNNQCMACGQCVKVCPVYLDVNLICRSAEFALFENCLEMQVDTCIECGLCAYHCPSGRALVQFIRLAKKEVESLKGEKPQ